MASFTAVMVRTRTKGTMVVNQDRDEICGINWNKERGGMPEAPPYAFSPSTFLILDCIWVSHRLLTCRIRRNRK